jgi:hypothetical protein
VYWYQKSRHHFLSAEFFGQSFKRVSMLIKAIGKHQPKHAQTKRPFLPHYYKRIIDGQGWNNRSNMNMYRWISVSHDVRVAWMAMVAARELLLRINQVCSMPVARHSDQRPWTRASVTFMAGERQIWVGRDGIPDQNDFGNLSHVLLTDQPEKSCIAGDREPYVCHVVPEQDLNGVSPDAPPAWLLQTGILIWLLFTTDPVREEMAPHVPLFASTKGELGAARLKYSAWHKVFTKLCKQATPPVPIVEDGKRLGGHCFRVAGCNAASDGGGTVGVITAMGKWSREAFEAAKGHDYLRSNRHAMRNVSIQMVIALMQIQQSDAHGWWHGSTITIRTDWALEAFFFAAAAGFVISAVLALCVWWNCSRTAYQHRHEQDPPMAEMVFGRGLGDTDSGSAANTAPPVPASPSIEPRPEFHRASAPPLPTNGFNDSTTPSNAERAVRLRQYRRRSMRLLQQRNPRTALAISMKESGYSWGDLERRSEPNE